MNNFVHIGSTVHFTSGEIYLLWESIPNSLQRYILSDIARYSGNEWPHPDTVFTWQDLYDRLKLARLYKEWSYYEEETNC